MSLKFVWLKILYISQRNCTSRFSPSLMFLKIARSLLNIEGMRTPFLGLLPIWPSAVGLAKQLVLTTNERPVGSAPVMPFIGSQRMFGRALIWPPVKSVIIVHTVAEVWNVPGGHT